MVRRRKSLPKREAGVFRKSTFCPSCSSKDNLAVYYHEETDDYSASCFGADCNEYFLNWDLDNDCPITKSGKKVDKETDDDEGGTFEMSLPMIETIRDDYIAYDNVDRKLRAEDYDFFGVKMELKDDGETINKIFYPTYRNSTHCGYRNRSRFEEGDPILEKKPQLLNVLKNFKGSIGDCKVGIELFGQHLFDPAKQKRLILTCGEEDTVATRKMLAKKAKRIDNYATVSTPSGENIKWIKPHLEWISRFEEIFIIADQDEAGEVFRDALVKILPFGKVRVVKLPKNCKDPCDVLKNNSFRDACDIFYRAIFDSPKWSPVGIKPLSAGWESYLNRGKDCLIPFPASFGDLQERTCGGAALGEIVTIAAPSSVGKSSFVKEWINTIWEDTDYDIGSISLEETLDEFIEGLLSVRMSTQLNEIPYDERDRDAEFAAFKELTGHNTDRGNRLHFVDHQGGCSTWEEMKAKIEFLIKGLDCKVIVFDPATLAVSTMHDVDEDEILSDILKLTKGFNILWVNVLHVRKNSNGATANSEGADITEEDIKGCLSADSEYLSPTGWKRMDSYDGGEIAEYCPITKTTRFVKPDTYVEVPCEQGFWHLKTEEGIDALVSDEHTMYYQKQGSEELHKITAKDMVEDHQNLPQGFCGRFETVSQGHTFGSGLIYSDAVIQLAIAYQANGSSHEGSFNSRFSLESTWKIERLKELLISAEIPYEGGEQVDGGTDIYCNIPLKLKVFDESWWSVNENQAKVILKESLQWNDCLTSHGTYFSNHKENCDFLQYLAMILGIRSTVTKEVDGAFEEYNLLLSEKPETTVSLSNDDKGKVIEKVPAKDGMKYCFVTSTGVFVSRRNGEVMMTGNTGTWFQVSMLNLLLSRNKVHDNPVIRNTTKIKMSKCRRHGKNTGIVGYSYYNGETGRLLYGQSPEEILKDIEDYGEATEEKEW